MGWVLPWLLSWQTSSNFPFLHFVYISILSSSSTSIDYSHLVLRVSCFFLRALHCGNFTCYFIHQMNMAQHKIFIFSCN